MSEWNTIILPFVLGIPALLLIFVGYYVIPAWINSFEEEDE
tara:strand:+ start:443 stop:565 length:123 start_codon:yes stop_codon:yes gene_type:complete